MSNKNTRIVFQEVAYVDKLEELVVELLPEGGEALTIPSGGYVMKIGEQTLATGASLDDGVIRVAGIVPAGVLEPGTYRNGILYPSTDVGANYFEIDFTIRFEQSIDN